MINRETPMAAALAALTRIEGDEEKSGRNLLEGLRQRRNGERLVESVREAAGDGTVTVVSGFVSKDVGNPADPETAEFRRATVRHSDGREEIVTVEP